jgi:hypothetical protein
MFCNERLESVHGGAKAGALGSSKPCLGYLRDAMEYGLRYLGDGEVKLQGYTESD